MDKISTFLWLDGRAGEAAEFYTGLLPDSRITLMPIIAHVFESADN
jgi:predicted 3-demethylubiquinone-9 3-methyltransferase (glyoxalase superfamily)